MIECIPDIDDREFISGPGHWLGQDAWSPDELRGRTGYIYKQVPANSGPYIISLDYPYLKPPPNRDITAKFYLTAVAEGVFSVTVSAIITDGLYEYEMPYVSGYPPLEWALLSKAITLPSDWNKLNSQLKITLVNIWSVDWKMCFDGFSIHYYAVKKQHLPVMGIG